MSDLDMLLHVRECAREARKALWAEGASEEARRAAAARLAVALSELQHPRMVRAADALGVGMEGGE